MIQKTLILVAASLGTLALGVAVVIGRTYQTDQSMTHTLLTLIFAAVMFLIAVISGAWLSLSRASGATPQKPEQKDTWHAELFPSQKS